MRKQISPSAEDRHLAGLADLMRPLKRITNKNRLIIINPSKKLTVLHATSHVSGLTY